jgi:hypothetical protein
MIALSLHIDWMELNIPIHMQAQTRANAPERVALNVKNISPPATQDMISAIIAELMSSFQARSLTKARKHFPTYTPTCPDLEILDWFILTPNPRDDVGIVPYD